MEFIKNIKLSVKNIYRNWFYLTFNIIIAVIYYYIFDFLIRYQNYGILLIETPIYLLYLMIGLSSILLTISIYSIKNTKKNVAKFSGSTLSSLVVIFGGVVGGCGCSAPIIYGLGIFGLDISATSSLAYYLNYYIIDIFYFMIIITLVSIFYYLNKLSSKNCIIKKKTKINK
ncbi:MAG: hypothetical protein QXD23_02945 [Candidatus Micrarchaeaceae archaeon]